MIPQEYSSYFKIIKWVTGTTALFLTAILSYKKIMNPELNIESYKFIILLIGIIAAFANIPFTDPVTDKTRQDFENELNQLKLDNSKLKSFEIIAINLSNKSNDDYDQGIGELGLGNYKNALKHFIKVNNKNKVILEKQAKALFYTGNAYYHLNQFENALNAFDKASLLDSSKSDIWFNKGLTLKELGKHEQEIYAYDQALLIKPEDTGILITKGASLSTFFLEHDKALNIFIQASEIDSDDLDVWYNKGIVLNRMKRHQEALVAFDKAILLDNENLDSINNKGITLSYLGENNLAIKFFNKAIKLNPKDINPLINKGIVLSNSGRNEQAQEIYLQALELSTEENQSQIDRFSNLIFLNQFKQ